MTYEIHEFCAMLPRLKETDPNKFEAFTESIRKEGLDEPVLMFEGRILDGQNRQDAWDALNRNGDMPTVEFKGSRKEALARVMRSSLMRRSLSRFQSGCLAVKAHCTDVGKCGVNAAKIKEIAGIALSTAQRAMDAYQFLRKEVFEECCRGSKNWSDVSTMVSQKKEKCSREEVGFIEDFREKLNAVKEGKYMKESIAKAIGENIRAVPQFLRMCAVSPEVEVVRTGTVKTRTYEFRLTGTDKWKGFVVAQLARIEKCESISQVQRLVEELKTTLEGIE